MAALRCHINDKSCTDCHYHNGVTCEPKRLTDDAADLIEAQQAELARVTAARDAAAAVIVQINDIAVEAIECGPYPDGEEATIFCRIERLSRHRPEKEA